MLVPQIRRLKVTSPDLQAKLDRWVTETGRGPDELVDDAMAGYFDELAQIREMLNSRYDALELDCDDQQARLRLLPELEYP